MTLEEIKQELAFCYSDNLNAFLCKNISELSEDEILKKFNEHIKLNSQKIKIKDLIEGFKEESFLLNTPDGYQEVGDFYIKGPKSLIEVKTIDNYKTISSDDHKFETQEGWKFAKDLNKKDFILSKEGFRKIRSLKSKAEEVVYDFEILHKNHRYWSGNGLSSHNTGKTYIALSICRNGIRYQGYDVIYFDSEGSIDRDFVARLGVDTSHVRLQPVQTVEEFSHIAAQITTTFEAMIEKGEQPPKTIVVLDSLGNLSSEKETGDTIEGSNKRDMTKQQAIRKLFRVNGLKFAKLGIPFIINNHTYDSLSMFSPKEISGGGGIKYNASIILVLGKGKLDDDEAEKKAKSRNLDMAKVGVTIYITPIKQRFARPIKVKIHIPFFKAPNPYVGLEGFVSWDVCGIMRGNMLSEKEYQKLEESDKKACISFQGWDLVKNEETGKMEQVPNKLVWAQSKETARQLVCKHLGGETPLADLFTDKVFTPEILAVLDEKVIKPLFQLPSIESLEDLEELAKAIGDKVSDEEE
jgi:RecA/RadA recombinase